MLSYATKPVLALSALLIAGGASFARAQEPAPAPAPQSPAPAPTPAPDVPAPAPSPTLAPTPAPEPPSQLTIASEPSAPSAGPLAWTAGQRGTVARSVVRVRSGGDWATGFVFGSAGHVLTSYMHVNESSDLLVVGSDSGPRVAHVVAWSEADDLALLEVDEELPAPPLAPAVETPAVGAAIAVLYHPAEPKADEESANAWSAPVVLFGHLGRVLEREVDPDIPRWGTGDDAGAPVVDGEGRVIAVVSAKSAKKNRMVATRVERAEKLFAERGRQGEFSPKAEKGLFSGFFWTPRHADAFMGMGFVVGYAYEWFALELLEGFYEASHRPIGDDTFESTTRFQIELDAEIQLRFGEYVRVYFGPGVQLNLDDKEIIEDASSVPTKREADDNEVRPAGTIGFSASVFFARVGISEQPRVDMGVVIGR